MIIQSNPKLLGLFGVAFVLLGVCLYITGVAYGTNQLDNTNADSPKKITDTEKGLMTASAVFTWVGGVLLVASHVGGVL